jgi:hypothetical protein
MNKLNRWIPFLALAGLIGCGEPERIPQDVKQDFPETLSVTVHNSLDVSRFDQAVYLDIQKLKDKSSLFNENAFVVYGGGNELPSQLIHREADGRETEILVTVDFKPKESKRLTILYRQTGKVVRTYPKRTQAELSIKTGGAFKNRKYEGGTFQNVQSLRVPPEHTDHSFFIRYEGPGWESDKVGYRFYLDWRNAIDLFGKRTPKMVLQNVGLDGFESYHSMSDWGMDILKVGESLGIGTIAAWQNGKAQRVAETDSVTCAITANGPIYSEIQTHYYGWKTGGQPTDLKSILSITAGSRLTRHDVALTGGSPQLCTGIVKLDQTRLIHSKDKRGDWAYLATFGKQSLADDSLGMAILYRTSDWMQFGDDGLSHVVVLNSSQDRLSYYFLAAWEKELQGIQNQESFVQYLDESVSLLDTPVMIAY